MKQQTFLADQAVDSVFGVVFALAAELYVTRNRLSALEAVLAEAGVVAVGAVEDHQPDAAAAAALDDYVEALFGPCLAREGSAELAS